MGKASRKPSHQDNSKVNSQIVIGIGASAGGLEALQDFFKAMPSNTNLVFVVIQHLSPDYRSLMDELLARFTSIPIHIATDGTAIEPNHIYLIPPRKNLSIFHNKIFLEDYNPKKGLNLPIDIFFRSLAADKGKNAIGIILSGTGSDGTLGTRAIKEAGGMVMVQDELTAKFDGMPRSSIATGLVDYILPPSKMPEALLNYIEHPFIRKSRNSDNILGKDLDTLTKITLILRDYCGIDFSYYKENTIIRRLERRVSINRFTSLEEYLVFLSESDKEKDILYREMLIGVTRFFRDTEAFSSIEKNVLPQLDYNPKVGLRVWSVGCSTGEEVYSLALLFLEYMSKHGLDVELKIFATDIDRHSLDVAGQGFYPDSIVSDIDPLLLAKYFTRKENGYQINENVRKVVVFATHNLLKDPPFSKLDLLVCRNLFIYFKPEMQQRILSMFYYAIKPSGYLFMGSSESIGEMSDAFSPVDSKWKVYKSIEGYKPPIIKDLPLPRTQPTETETQFILRSRLNPGPKIDKLLDGALASFLPPSVIIDQNENIIHIVNDINKFIQIHPGRFSQNLMSLLKSELSLFVNNLIRKLKKGEKEVFFENISGVKGLEDQKINLEGRTLSFDRSTFFIISFRIAETKKVKPKSGRTVVDIEVEVNNRVVELEKELQTSRENLQATVEELETSNEELQSSNEELIASNEELQSTNEELQSVNEELFTVNSEYQSKIEELTRLTNDLDNLLKNTEVGALYLDRNLCIRKITPVVTTITNILPTDMGRPISHIAFMANYSDILDDVHSVVETLQSVDKEIIDRNGKVWQARVRPYRTDYNAVEGIMITFIDITKLKKIEVELKELNRKLLISDKVFKHSIDMLCVAGFDGYFKTLNPAWERTIGWSNEELLSKPWIEFVHPDDRHDTENVKRTIINGQEIYQFENRYICKDGTIKWLEWNSFPYPDDSIMIGAARDVTKQKMAEREVQHNQKLLQKILDNSPLAKTLLNSEGNIIYANKPAENIFGISQEEILTRTYDASQWRITDFNGKSIPSDKLPFALIKSTGKSLLGFKHYIEVPGKEKVLLIINGTPIFRENMDFEGAVFSIGICNE